MDKDSDAHAMLTIYAIPVSLYCAKLRILLRYKQLQWQEVLPPGGYGSKEYKRTVPSGNLPALRDDDLLLADSEAIAEYLNEKFPSPPMLPVTPGDRAKVRELSRFHDARLEPAVRALFPMIPPAKADKKLIGSQVEEINARLEQLGHMRPTATADVSLGDCGYPITFAWIDQLAPRMALAIQWPATVNTYRHWLKEQPAIIDELADYVPKLANWFDGHPK